MVFCRHTSNPQETGKKFISGHVPWESTVDGTQNQGWSVTKNTHPVLKAVLVAHHYGTCCLCGPV